MYLPNSVLPQGFHPNPPLEMKSHCDELTKFSAGTVGANLGDVIFPGESKVMEDSIRIDTSKDVTIPPNASPNSIVIERRRFTAPILVTLCIDYQASLEPSHHQTAYAFYLMQTIPEIKGTVYVDPARRGAVPAATMGFTAPQLHSNQYAN